MLEQHAPHFVVVCGRMHSLVNASRPSPGRPAAHVLLRCVYQVIVVAHATEDCAAFYPGHAYRFRPVPVTFAFSRSAALEPCVQPSAALWHFWQDRRGMRGG